MIRQGKAAGWLQLPPEALLPWAELNDVNFERVIPGIAVGKGGALLAKERTSSPEGEGLLPLMTVSRDLILSLERVQEHAKVDRDLREVLESLGEFGTVSGFEQPPYLTSATTVVSLLGPTISLVLMRSVDISRHHPHFSSITSFSVVPGPTESHMCSQPLLRVSPLPHIPCASAAQKACIWYADRRSYVKSLPCELLPTFWTVPEQELLLGTTLAPAVSAKLKSLLREYDLLCEKAQHTRWYSIAKDTLDFDDWLQVDAMYRSRALDFPNIGHCMVPCIDLANHAAGENTDAIYEKGEDGNAVLLLRRGKQLEKDDEVTITYGDEKGACEMLFSYGFLEADRQSAEMLFLSLTIPQDDQYRAIKAKLADCAPGFKITDTGDGEVDWSGDFVWLLCVTADDGLRFEIARTVDGEEEAHAFFEDHELTGGAAQLHGLLVGCDLWDLYRLRAIALLQQRVFDQMQVLYSTQDDMEAVPHGDGTEVRLRCYQQAMQLRRLEFELLEKAYGSFEKQVGDACVALL